MGMSFSIEIRRIVRRTYISTICGSYDTGYGAFSASNAWCLCPYFTRNCVSLDRASRLPSLLAAIVTAVLGRDDEPSVAGRGVETRVTVDCVAKLWRGVGSMP